jgi:hypothetical protein
MKKFAHWPALTLLLLALFGGQGFSARAQGTAYAEIGAPDTSAFPAITTLLDAYDGRGQFATGLQPQSITLLENGQAVRPEQIIDLQPGIKFAVAINAGPAIAVRDGFGVSRYDKAVMVLSNWASARSADSRDALSLTANNGTIFFDVGPAEWQKRLAEFDPQAREAESGLTALSFALDVVESGALEPGGKRAVLLISPHLEQSKLAGLDALAARAAASQTRIYLWLIDSQSYFSHSGAQALKDLAINSGGQALEFSGTETLPDPEVWLEPLRHVYRLTYASQIRSGGTHTLVAQVTVDGTPLTTSTRSFDLDVQPPNPILLSPPNQIVRENKNDPFDLENLTPREQVLEAIIEFPDGHPRPLVRTTLYVDDQIVHENRAEPFDRFIWDLRGLKTSGAHNLHIEAVDSLGLSHTSMDLPVQITVIRPPGGLSGLMLRYQNWIVSGVVALAGLALIAIFIRFYRRRGASSKEQREARRKLKDPLTQPVPGTGEQAGAKTPSAFPWMRRRPTAAPAYFVRLTSDGQPAPDDPLALVGNEFTFGADPAQATNLLGDASVSALHARLKCDEKGNYTLFDQNSISGTWVNYEALGREGQVLRHGDVVNFGKLTYRFVLRKNPAAVKPTILPDKK